MAYGVVVALLILLFVPRAAAVDIRTIPEALAAHVGVQFARQAAHITHVSGVDR